MAATVLSYPEKFILFSNFLTLRTGKMVKSKGEQEMQRWDDGSQQQRLTCLSVESKPLYSEVDFFFFPQQIETFFML